MTQHLSFTAQMIQGEGKGKELGSPTINLNLDEVPEKLEEGVYAVWATVDEKKYAATMHYGPRPTLGFKRSCEVHLLQVSDVRCQVSDNVHVEVVERMRDVQDFGDEEGLKSQIKEDIEHTKTILHVS